MTSTFLVFFPMMLLSGFAFPVANMPEPVQWLTRVNPICYFLVIVRAIFRKVWAWRFSGVRCSRCFSPAAPPSGRQSAGSTRRYKVELGRGVGASAQSGPPCAEIAQVAAGVALNLDALGVADAGNSGRHGNATIGVVGILDFDGRVLRQSGRQVAHDALAQRDACLGPSAFALDDDHLHVALIGAGRPESPSGAARQGACSWGSTRR